MSLAMLDPIVLASLPPSFIVTGTDTDVGKTYACRSLLAALPDRYYWKPIQTGSGAGPLSTDSDVLRRDFSNRILPEAYSFLDPVSPHIAAEREDRLIRPPVIVDIYRKQYAEFPVIIEGAGGLLVPLTKHYLMRDLFVDLALPIIIVARTALGTINHTLLTIEAAAASEIPVLGVLFSGKRNKDVERSIAMFSDARILGCLGELGEREAYVQP